MQGRSLVNICMHARRPGVILESTTWWRGILALGGAVWEALMMNAEPHRTFKGTDVGDK